MEVPPDSKRALNIDSRSNQASQHQNPIEKYRQTTDKVSLFIFPVIIAVWVIICILGYIAPQHHDGSSEAKLIILYQWYFNAPLHSFSIGFILSIIISIAAVCICALLTLKFTKFFVNIGLGLFILGTIGYIYQAVVGTIFGLGSIRGLQGATSSISSLLYTWLAVIYMVTAAYCYLKADKGVLTGLTKDSYQAIIYSPAVIIFVAIITISTGFVLSFFFNAMIYDIFAARNMLLVAFYLIIIIFGGICALSFFPFLAVVVVTDYAINYYWKKDESTSSLLGRSISNTFRYHIGTIMFASTAFFATICAIIQAIRHSRSWQSRENSIFYVVSKVYLALRMPEIALIFTAVYGTGYVKSAQTAFEVILRRCPLFLATLAACEAIVYIPAFLAIIGSIIVLVIESVGDPDSVEGRRNLLLLVHGLLYPLICFILLVWFTMKAMLINKIIMLNKEEQDTEGKVQILNRA